MSIQIRYTDGKIICVNTMCEALMWVNAYPNECTKISNNNGRFYYYNSKDFQNIYPNIIMNDDVWVYRPNGLNCEISDPICFHNNDIKRIFKRIDYKLK